jgi:Mn2+/Fe2+ NRAMP family transporter
MNARKLLQVALGIVTSIGGFLEAGSIATSAQAGAGFQFRLIWPIVLGTLLLIFLIEMSGRLAAMSHKPLPAAVRERFGFNFFIVPLIAGCIVDFLVLGSEVGGASYGLQLVTGISFRVWAIPVVFAAWLLLWNGTFGIIEYGVSTLGLITLVFAVAAVKLRPDWLHVAAGVLPTPPQHHAANYWFLVVSILGATVSPFLFNFYSSGAVEDKWTEKQLPENRLTAAIGMSFGGLLSIAVLVCAACVLFPNASQAQTYDQIQQIVVEPLGPAAHYIFGATLFIACLGAMTEVSLDSAYVCAQGFGWNWGENKSPRDTPQFSLLFSFFLISSAIFSLLGVSPLGLTIFSMAFTTLILPLIVLPFLVLMNDEHYIGPHGNGWFTNSVVFFAILLASILALVAIPLEIFGASPS